MLAIIITSTSACAENETDKVLVGKWLYKGTIGQTSMVECPDLIQLNSDGTYYVLNDCYAVDARLPITERGDWIYDKANMEIHLINRIYNANYYFGYEKDALVIKVKKISDHELNLSLQDSENRVDIERYGIIR